MTRLSHLPAAVLFCLAAALPAQADVLIATAGPMSGNTAAFGEQMRRGAQKAVDDINATGGLRGERLALIVGDDGCDPRKAVEVATDFVSQRVRFVAGHFCSGASIPAAKVYEAASIVQISPASTNPKFTEEGLWNVFRVASRDDAQGSFAGAFIAARFRDKRIAILNDSTPSGSALAARAREALGAAGVAVAIDESYKPGGKDYSELALRLRDAAVDAIYLGGSYVEAGSIVRELRGLGSTAQLIGGDGLLTDEFWKVAGDAGEGTLVTFALDPQTFESARQIVQRFADDEFNPEGHTLHAYAAVQAWVQAAEATNGTDSHAIARWLRAGNAVKTVLGDIRFDAKGDVADPRFAWYRWTDGKYVLDQTIR